MTLLGTEAIRVCADRLIDLNDYQKAKDIYSTGTIKNFEGVVDSQIIIDEMMFCAFPPDGAMMMRSPRELICTNGQPNTYYEGDQRPAQ